MTNQKLFIVSAPRSGAGLFHELVLLDPIWSSSELSEGKLLALAKSLSHSKQPPGETSARSFFSDRISEIGGDVHSKDLLLNQRNETNDLGNRVDYHPSLGMNIDSMYSQYPDSKFIYVSRDTTQTVISSTIAWQSAEFVYHPELPNWWGSKWSFPLISHWPELVGEPIADITARQFLEISSVLVSDLAKLPKNSWAHVRFEELLHDPQGTVSRAMTELGLSWNATLPKTLPRSKGGGLFTPDASRNSIRPGVLGAVDRQLVNYPELPKLLETVTGSNLLSPRIDSALEAGPKSGGLLKVSSEATPMKADYTGAFVELLTKAKASLIFSAYNSGYLGTVRADGASLDTGYCQMQKPMGIALSDSKLSISTEDSVTGFHKQNGLASMVARDAHFDAVFVPQSTVYTGNIAIHDMAYGSAPGFEGLWFANTAFSCVSKLDHELSFVPVWRPKWISSLAHENRCHLNGLAMVDGAPRYVTSLSQADTPGGWREHKGTGGVIVDIKTDRVIASGLSMPHSPRWHMNKLYFLESGKGSLALVDHRSGEVTTIATLPGFTRGLAFIGNYALVGLSQVRDSAFKDLPVTSTKQERNCGIWVVDIRSGKTVGTLKFEGAIQELFDIVVVENSSWPVIIDRIPQAAMAFVLSKAALRQVKGSPPKP
jgi:uncharacterized protein (TIGR03032 family)